MSHRFYSSEPTTRNQPTLSTGQFSVIYADPPWQFKTWNPKSGTHDQPWRTKVSSANGRVTPYDCLTTEEIGGLPIQGLCARDCVLFLWAIYPMLPAAFEVLTDSGFVVRTVAFTWVKSNPSGIGYSFGLGYWTRPVGQSGEMRWKMMSRSIKDLSKT